MSKKSKNPKKLAAQAAVKEPSFRHLALLPSETAAMEGLEEFLRDEINARADTWGRAAWEALALGAQARFGEALAGLVSRARAPKVQALWMLKTDIIRRSSIASAHIAYLAGRLSLDAPTLAWAAIPISLAQTADLALMRYLIAVGAKIDAREDGATALSYVISREKPPAAHPPGMRLLLAAGADPDPSDRFGQSPVWALCSFWSIEPSIAELIRDLRARGADMAATRSGKSALGKLREGNTDYPWPEPEESRKLRRELLAECEQDEFAFLPPGAPSVRADINDR